MYDRLARIDGLRALAIFGVVAIHTGVLKISANDFLYKSELVDIGKYGVELFFLLSGFVLCYVAQNSNFSKSKFFIKRIFRLVPIYYLVFFSAFIYYLYFKVGFDTTSLNSKNIFLHLTFLHGLSPEYIRSVFSVVWSLTPEFIFYIFFPVLYKFSSKTLVLILLASIISSKFSIPIAEHLFSEKSQQVTIWAHLSPLANMMFFIFGMIVYKVPDFFKQKIVQLISFSFLALMFINPFYPVGKDFIKIWSLLFSDFYFGLALLSFPFLIYSELKLVKLLFDNKISSFVGRISYSIFFIHYAVILILLSYNQTYGYFLSLSLVLLITIIVSYVTFICVEKPGIRMGSNIVKKFENYGNLFLDLFQEHKNI